MSVAPVGLTDSPSTYLFLPQGNVNPPVLSRSTKSRVKWTRMFQLVLRCLELVASLGILVIMVMMKGVDSGITWIVRIIVSWKNPVGSRYR